MLIGADIAVLRWVVEPDVFIKKPVWSSWRVVEKLGIAPNIVAVDPPWVDRGSSRRVHHGLDRALGTPRVILRYAAEAALRLGSRYLLVHYKDPWIPDGFEVVAELVWKPVTRYQNTGVTWWGLLKRGG